MSLPPDAGTQSPTRVRPALVDQRATTTSKPKTCTRIRALGTITTGPVATLPAPSRTWIPSPFLTSCRSIVATAARPMCKIVTEWLGQVTPVGVFVLGFRGEIQRGPRAGRHTHVRGADRPGRLPRQILQRPLRHRSKIDCRI